MISGAAEECHAVVHINILKNVYIAYFSILRDSHTALSAVGPPGTAGISLDRMT